MLFFARVKRGALANVCDGLATSGRSWVKVWRGVKRCLCLTWKVFVDIVDSVSNVRACEFASP